MKYNVNGQVALKALFSALFLLSLIVMSAPAFAAEATAGKPVQDKPAKGIERSTIITVVNEGTDSIGARFSTKLKELFNASNLFNLSEKDVPKLRVIITTQSEFSNRPGVGSVYSIVWAFAQNEANLGYMLSREIGTVNSDDLEALANKIVERTDGIAVKYSYLFQ